MRPKLEGVNPTQVVHVGVQTNLEQDQILKNFTGPFASNTDAITEPENFWHTLACTEGVNHDPNFGEWFESPDDMWFLGPAIGKIFRNRDGAPCLICVHRHNDCTLAFSPTGYTSHVNVDISQIKTSLEPLNHSESLEIWIKELMKDPESLEEEIVNFRVILHEFEQKFWFHGVVADTFENLPSNTKAEDMEYATVITSLMCKPCTWSTSPDSSASSGSPLARSLVWDQSLSSFKASPNGSSFNISPDGKVVEVSTGKMWVSRRLFHDENQNQTPELRRNPIRLCSLRRELEERRKEIERRASV